MHPSYDEGPRRPTAGPTPAVVLLHGQPGTAADWYRVIPLLSVDFRVIAVDRPGYAGDPQHAGDWASNAAALLRMMDSLEIDCCVLVAASWAGGIAVEIATRAPERLAGVVYVASVGGGGAITLLDRLTALRPVLAVGVRIAQHTNVGFTRILARAAGSRLDEQAVREARLSATLWRERRVWAAAALEQRALVRDDELLRAMVTCASVPSVVIQGTRDLTLPPKAGAALADALPQASLVKVDAGHMVAFEEPIAIARAVRSLHESHQATP